MKILLGSYRGNFSKEAAFGELFGLKALPRSKGGKLLGDGVFSLVENIVGKYRGLWTGDAGFER
jgi:hypothetical protein